MTLEVKIDGKLIPIESGLYILVFNPKYTNQFLIDSLIKDLEKDAPDCKFVILPSLDPNSVRLLKAEIPEIVTFSE